MKIISENPKIEIWNDDCLTEMPKILPNCGRKNKSCISPAKIKPMKPQKQICQFCGDSILGGFWHACFIWDNGKLGWWKRRYWKVDKGCLDFLIKCGVRAFYKD